jgi:hypothetical protein
MVAALDRVPAFTGALVSAVQLGADLPADFTAQRRAAAVNSMAAVDFTVEAGSTAEATGNCNLTVPFTKAAGARGCQPLLRSCEWFTTRADATYVVSRKKWYTEGAPVKHHRAITGSQIAHPRDDPGIKGTIGLPYK